MVFSPTEDITAYELAKLLNLLLAGEIGRDIEQILPFGHGSRHAAHGRVDTGFSLEVTDLLLQVVGILPGELGEIRRVTVAEFTVATLAHRRFILACDRIALADTLLDIFRTIAGIGGSRREQCRDQSGGNVFLGI